RLIYQPRDELSTGIDPINRKIWVPVSNVIDIVSEVNKPHPKKEWSTNSITTFLHSTMADDEEEEPKPNICKYSMIRNGYVSGAGAGDGKRLLMVFWRINHLLHQIARMNKLLLATRHGVAITSKAGSGTKKCNEVVSHIDIKLHPDRGVRIAKVGLVSLAELL
ncbi:hypothetical protein M8C21_029775, partial [Ambrosia artemisiifolia]